MGCNGNSVAWPKGWDLASASRFFASCPFAQLLIRVAAVAVIVPILVEPTFRNILVLGASFTLALAYLLKDYGSSFVAGPVTVMENVYHPGDWINVYGHYGEVKAIASRAVHLRTADDTEVIIPHSRPWSTSFLNSTSGKHTVLCIASFYLHPDHDAAVVQEKLTEAATSSYYCRPDSPVSVTAMEKPWGTHYRIKPCKREQRTVSLHHGYDDSGQGHTSAYEYPVRASALL